MEKGTPDSTTNVLMWLLEQEVYSVHSERKYQARNPGVDQER